MRPSIIKLEITYQNFFVLLYIKTDNFFSFQVNWKSYLDFLDYLIVSKI